MCGVNAFTITEKHFGEHEQKDDNERVADLRNQKVSQHLRDCHFFSIDNFNT